MIGSQRSFRQKISVQLKSTIVVVKVCGQIGLTGCSVGSNVILAEHGRVISADVGLDGGRARLAVEERILSASRSVLVENAVAIVSPFVNEDFAFLTRTTSNR